MNYVLNYECLNLNQKMRSVIRLLRNKQVLPIYSSPNFSIIAPTDCQADCKFCSWRETLKYRNYLVKRPNELEYYYHLEKTLDNLPPEFKSISITGAEPTRSLTFLEHLLKLVNKKKFPKVVLTTNGGSSDSYQRLFSMPEINKINHINLSRHSISDLENKHIFGVSIHSHKILDTVEVKDFCYLANRLGIDVTLQSVITDFPSDPYDVHQFIKFAKDVGASGITFRKQYDNTLNPTPIEKQLRHYKYQESSCPVCVTRRQIIDGMTINWKASIAEPTEVLVDNKNNPYVYELIVQQDGTLTLDWRGDMPVEVVKIRENNKQKYQLSESEHIGLCNFERPRCM